MEKKILKEVRTICKPLYSLKSGVKAVWVYGSVVRKKVEKGSDIDVLVLVDDTLEELNIEKVELTIKQVEEVAEKKSLRIHFQPPKRLTMWWDLVRTGEPWTITALRTSTIIYDPSGYVTLLKSLLKKGEVYSTDQRAEKLVESAKSKLNEVRHIFLERIPLELLMAMTEAAQMSLMYYGKFPPAPKNVSYELRKYFVNNNMLKPNIVEYYEDVFDLVEKIHRGTLSEFDGKDLDKHLAKAKDFLKIMEELLLKLEHKRREKGMEESYKSCMELCEEALKKKIKLVPKDDLEKIKLFKKKFIDTNLIGKSHYKTLTDLYLYKTSKKRRLALEKEKYLDGTYIRSLKIAIKETA